MKKETILAVCMVIFIAVSWGPAPAADGNKGAVAGDLFRGGALDQTPETEQGASFAAVPRANTVPTEIYPGDYEVILKDSEDVMFYLNEVKRNGVRVLYRGYWPNKWANGLIEPVTASYYIFNTLQGPRAAMAITAVYKEDRILSYTLIKSDSGKFYGSWWYAFKDNLHYLDKVWTITVTVEKGVFPTIIGDTIIYATP